MTILFSLLLSLLISPISSDTPTPLTASETDKMKEVASMVLNDLKRAKGILPGESPQLTKVFRFRGNGKLATIFLDKGEIHLDSKTYLTCRGMGKDSLNALAFLLGHELGHFINNHNGINHNIVDAVPSNVTQFAAVNRALNEENVSDNFENRLNSALQEYHDTHDEAEADFEGAFLGYLAGYQTLDAGRTFLERAYRNLGVDSSATGYPTLEERLAIIDKTSQELQQLTPLFELSHYLVAAGQYGDAIPLLEKVLTKFESPEIYNNLGVIHLLQLQTLFKTPLSKYNFPLTLDANFKVPHPQAFDGVFSFTPGLDDTGQLRTVPPCQLNIFQLQIEIAENYFMKATMLDQDYSLAYLNLSIALTMKGILYAARYEQNSLAERNNIVHEAPNCSMEREETFRRARNNAHLAKSYCEKTLQGICLEYYPNPPSRSHTLLSFPDGVHYDRQTQIRRVPEPPHHAEMVLVDSNGVTTSHIFDSSYPIYLECFNDYSFLSDSFHLDVKHTRWLTDQNIIPENGIVLSNIAMQMDIINLVNPSVSSDSTFHSTPLGKKLMAPFQRALEINPNNSLALENKEKHSGTRVRRAISAQGVSPCTSVEKIEDKRITEIFNSTTGWDYVETISKPRIISFYKSAESISSNEKGKLFSESVKANQTIKYKLEDNFMIYSSTANIGDRLTEAIIFVRPTSFTNPTSCDIEIGNTKTQMLSKYKTPDNELLSNLGSMTTHVLETSTIQEEIEDIDDWLAPKQSSIQNLSDGLIFRLDNQNKLEGWILFHKSSTTMLKEEG